VPGTKSFTLENSEKNFSKKIRNQEDRIMAELRQRLFEVMRNDIGVMAEHNDSEASLLAELNNADQDILEAYADTFLE
jgi:hypothetical protein